MPNKPATPGTGLTGPLYILDENAELIDPALPDAIEVDDPSSLQAEEVEAIVDAINGLLARIR